MNVIDWKQTDALIFDMDGTLWDAVDSYCAVWNACFRMFGVSRVVTRDELLACMGLPLSEIYTRLCGETPSVSYELFLPAVEKAEAEMMPVLGGRPYPGVKESIGLLSGKYRIFLLSNCGKNGLRDMMDWLGIGPYVTEAVTFGETGKEKSENMKILKAKYGLVQPVYVGDTEGDCRQTHVAELPFVHAAYGFGCCTDADLSFDSFMKLTEFFLKLK